MISAGGIIENVFDPKELEQWQSYFQKWSMTGDHILNCYGIDKKNPPAEAWFQKNVFSKVKDALGFEMKSVFGMYAESVNPYPIHTDSYHIEKNNINGQSSVSWLVPYKVDGSTEKIHMASTIVFNEKDLRDKKNAIGGEISKRYLGHCDRDHIEKVTIFDIIHWKPGSLIWWDMDRYHCSGSFEGFSTKEMFVGHTFK